MKKLAILGASYLQLPLIKKAKELGIETHVFAWEHGAIAKEEADFFYPISILEKEEILKNCQKIGIHGITTIATDIAMNSVSFIADAMGLIGNSLKSTFISTDKYEMRKALKNADIFGPQFSIYEQPNFKNIENYEFPIIVKPTDRSGSRGVTKVFDIEETNLAIVKALDNSIKGHVIVEEFIHSDREFSIEFISFNGKHYPLAITDKVSTRAPHFVEIEHHQPADISIELQNKMFEITKKVLDSLEVTSGSSHTEVYLLSNDEIIVVESAGRMGGDLIGSHLVPLSTGFDFLHATIDVALNQFHYEKYSSRPQCKYSGVYFIIPSAGKIKERIDNSCLFKDVVHCEALMEVGDVFTDTIDGADKRAGIIVYSSNEPRPFSDPSTILNFITE